MLSQKELNELFDYKDGILIWKRSTCPKIKNGTRAGCTKSIGRRAVSMHGSIQQEHRVIWVMHNGDIPKGLVIDHIDNDPLNNKIENLRLATNSQNCYNQSVNKKNTVGVKGVWWYAKAKSWRVRIKANGRMHYKHFRSLDEAKEGHRKLAIELHGEFARS
jgi:hypothetical protein